MARIRSVKPEFWRDRKLARKTSRDARMLYVGLWNYADEHERANGDVVVIKGDVFPYDDDIDTARIEILLKELESAGVVTRYTVDGDPFLHLPNLHKHQRLEPAKVASRFPSPDDADLPGPVCAGSESRADLLRDDQAQSANTPPDLHTQIFSDKSAPRSDRSAKKSALQGTGSMGQGTGNVSDGAPSANGGKLIKEHIDACRKRPPERVVGQLAKHVGEMLAEGIDPDDIRAGLAKFREKGDLHPSTLSSLVNAAMNAPRRAPRRQDVDPEDEKWL